MDTRSAICALTLALALGCGARTTEPEEPRDQVHDEEPTGGAVGGGGGGEPAPPPGDDAEWAGDGQSAQAGTTTGGQACTTSADCAQGEQCFGPEGCGVQWTCVAARPCTRDLAQYCGCDGTTVEGSGSCPPRAYSHRGPCP